MSFRSIIAAVTILAGASIAAPLAMADSADSRVQVLAQAAGQRGEHPRGAHFDPNPGDSQQPHNPNAASQQAGGSPAHFDPPRGDGQQPHRPGATTGQAGGGAPAHFDATHGGGQQPHAPDRGAPQPGR